MDRERETTNFLWGVIMAEGTAKTLAVLSLVMGILSLVVMAVIFGPASIVCGTIAGTQGRTMGWWGMALGVVGVIAWSVIMFSAMS